MNTLGTYRGYTGSIESDNGVFHGSIQGIKACVTYESDSLHALCKEFRAAVDDYLEFCKQEGFEPEVPK